jgi:hypothetical protein
VEVVKFTTKHSATVLFATELHDEGSVLNTDYTLPTWTVIPEEEADAIIEKHKASYPIYAVLKDHDVDVGRNPIVVKFINKTTIEIVYSEDDQYPVGTVLGNVSSHYNKHHWDILELTEATLAIHEYNTDETKTI